jgi:four helix bundle protein
MYKDFTEMPVWCDAMEVAVAIFHLSVPLPKSEDYALKSQIRRSAESISANIAEAFGRFHKKDKINFYYYAKGSAYETKSHLIYGNQTAYFTDDKINNLNQKIDNIIHNLNKIIKTLNSLS